MVKNNLFLRRTIIVVSLAIALVLCIVILYTVSTKKSLAPSSDSTITVFTSLNKLESSILNSDGNDFERLTLLNTICYASYNSSAQYLQFTLVESNAEGNYIIKNQSEKISFSEHEGITTALYATYKLVPISFIFSPTPIKNTEAYNKIDFPDAYLYYKLEDKDN